MTNNEPDYPLAADIAQNAETGEHRNQYHSIVYNLALKKAKGVYDPAKAPTLWKYLVDNVARDYQKENGITVNRATRNDAIERLMESSNADIEELAKTLADGKRDNGKYPFTMSDYVNKMRAV